MKFFPLILSALLFLSCGEEQEVKWPSLNELGNVSTTVASAASNHEKAKQKQLLKEAHALITQVSANVPSNVQNKQAVKILLQDLTSLTPQLGVVDTLSPSELNALANSLSPLVTEIMATSGVPHSCSSCASCGSLEKSHNHADHGDAGDSTTP